MKKLNLLLCIVAATFLYSCDDENDPVADTEKPVVTITSPTESAFHKGIIQITASATDNTGIQSLKLYVDDVLIKEQESGALSELWDSKTIQDGVHTLKIIATDHDGNEALVTAKFEVLNYFFVLDVSDAVLNGNVDYWYFISHSDGSLVRAEQLLPGAEEIKFETPDGFSPDQTFTLGQFSHLDLFGTYNTLTLNPNYKAGKYKFSPAYQLNSESQGPVTVGAHDLRVENLQSPFAWLYGDDVHSVSINEDATGLDCEISLLKNNANIYIAFQPNFQGPPRYKTFQNVNAGEHSSFNYDQLDLMEGNTVPVSVNAETFSTEIWGYPEQGNYNELMTLWLHPNSSDDNPVREHQYYHLGNRFAEYQFYAYENEGSRTYGYISIGKESPSQFKRGDAIVKSFTYNGTTITMQTEGAFDFMTLQGSATLSGTVNSWSIMLPDGENQHVIVPSIPDEILQYGFPDRGILVFENANYIEFSGLDGYYEYVDFLKDGPRSVYEISKEIYFGSMRIDNAGGRRYKGANLTSKEWKKWIESPINYSFSHSDKH